MKAVLLTGYGDYDKNKYVVDYPIPSPLASQVRIKVLACGINNTDIWTRKGAYSSNPDSQSGWQTLKFPRIQGADICGIITDVGNDVDKNRLGERVIVYPAFYGPNGIVDCNYLGSELDGGFAQFCVVDSDNAIKIANPARI